MKRRDAKPAQAPGLQSVMFHLFPNRTEAEVYLNDLIDITEVQKYLEKKNAQHPEYKTTLFHCIIFAVAKMCMERPRMNYFVAGHKLWERNELSIGFVVKKQFNDHSDEGMMVLFPDKEDNLEAVSKKIFDRVYENKNTEAAVGKASNNVDALAKLPNLLLMLIVRIVRMLSFWGKVPKALTEDDPNHCSVFLTNLGSIHCPAVYHHLNNYGTNSFMLAVGEIHKAELIDNNEEKHIRTVVDIGAILDERIADGFYFARSLKLVKYIFAHPEMMDRPLLEPSGFDYK